MYSDSEYSIVKKKEKKKENVDNGRRYKKIYKLEQKLKKKESLVNNSVTSLKHFSTGFCHLNFFF